MLSTGLHFASEFHPSRVVGWEIAGACFGRSLITMSTFVRTIGIDYSGAKTPTSSLEGLRVYLAEGDAAPAEVPPPLSSRKYWTRRGVAEWLVDRLSEKAPTLVGIDHGFSFRNVTSTRTGWSRIGLRSSTIFTVTGRPTRTIPMSISCVTAVSATVRRARGALGGGASPRNAPAERSQSSISMCRDRSRNLPMPGFLGCVSSGGSSAAKCISGRSTAGRFRPDDPRSSRSILPCGRTDSGTTAAPATSMTPSVLRPGFRVPTATGAFRRCLSPVSHR